MQQKQLFGVLGSIMLFMGMFCPTIRIGTDTAIYFHGGNSFTDLILVLAVISFILAVNNHFKWVLYTGIVSMVMLLISFYNQVTEQSFMNDAVSTLRHFGSRRGEIWSMEFGWGILFIGAGLIYFPRFGNKMMITQKVRI